MSRIMKTNGIIKQTRAPMGTTKHGSWRTLPRPEMGGKCRTVVSVGLSSAGTHELSGMPDSSGPMPVMMVPQLGALTDGIWSRATAVVEPLE